MSGSPIIAKNPALQHIVGDPELMKERVQMWSEDFLLWFFDCFFTKDEGMGLERLAPRYEYIRSIHEAVEENRIIWIEKSRQLFVTWYMVGRFLWKLMYKRDIRLIYGSRVEDDVRDVIKTRFKEAYDRLDRAFPVPTLIFKSLSIENPLMGTMLQGMSSSGQGSRGKTGAELWLDEIAFQKEQESLVRSSMESLNAPGSKLIGVTTSNPKPEADSTKKMIAKSINVKIPPVAVSRGVTKRYNMQGHCILSVIHYAHPDKQEAWKEAKIKEIGPLAFSIEHGLNWDVARGSPCFWGFDVTRHQKKLQFDPYLPLRITLDPGTGHPAVTYFQRGRDRKCRIYHAFTREQTNLKAICSFIEQDIMERFNGHEDFEFYVDPAGDKNNPHGTEIACDVLFEYFGKPVHPAPQTNPDDRLIFMNNFFQNDMVEVEEGCGEYYDAEGNVETAAFIYMMTTGYVTNNRGLAVKDGKWDHSADSFGYGFIQVFHSGRDIGAKSTEQFSVRPTYYDQQIVKQTKVRPNYLTQ